MASLNRPLRVLVILNSIGGGATQGIKEMMMSMAAGKIDFYLVFPEEPNDTQIDWLKKYAAGWKTVKLNWWNKNLNLPLFWRFVRFVIDNAKSVFRIRHVAVLFTLVRKWNIDIVYTATSLNIEGAIVAKITNKPHVWHLKETFGVGGRVKFLLPDNKVPGFLLKLSDKVVVMTEYIRSFFGEHRNNSKIEVVYDAVSVGQFVNCSGAMFRQKLGIQSNEFLVAMIASLAATWKNHELFLKTVALLKDRHPQVKFAVFGPEPKKYSNPAYNVPWNYYQSLKATAAQLQLEESIIWGGFHSNIPELMNGIDLLVHTCETEPFGRIAIEAMAAGKPVIGPTLGGIAETVKDRETGILATAGSAPAFAEAIEFLIKNQVERERMGAEGKEFIVSSHYDQHIHNQKMLDIFSSLKYNKFQ